MIVCEDCGTAGHSNLQCERCVEVMNEGFDDIRFLGPEESRQIRDEVLGAFKRDKSARTGRPKPGWANN